MIITNLQHFEGAMEDPTVPTQVKQMAAFFSALVEDGRDLPFGEELPSTVPCMAGPQGRWCLGILDVCRQESPAEIHWNCAVCAKSGIISHYESKQTLAAV